MYIYYCHFMNNNQALNKLLFTFVPSRASSMSTQRASSLSVSQCIEFHHANIPQSLESPLDSKEIKPINPKGNQP